MRSREYMRSRAALLPYPGDPFLLNYWLKFFDEVWGAEVDTLYIHLNSSIEQAVVDYITQICESRPKVKLFYTPYQTDHGPSIDRLLTECQEDLVMLIEDDGFIFKSFYVDNYFKRLEVGEYDLIGSPRGSCSMEILTAAQNKWGISYEGEGDHGPNFWPNFLFCKADLLRATDRHFSARQWKQGEIIKGLEHEVVSEFVNGDTLVNTSLQLRGMVPINKILTIPQYHGHPSDLDHLEQGKYLFDGNAPWTHIGSLSSGVGGILMDQEGRQLSRRKSEEPKGPTKLPHAPQTEMEREEYERRVQWWRKFINYFAENTTGEESDELLDFADAYKKAVQQIINQFELNTGRIDRRDRAYASLGL